MGLLILKRESQEIGKVQPACKVQRDFALWRSVISAHKNFDCCLGLSQLGTKSYSFHLFYGTQGEQVAIIMQHPKRLFRISKYGLMVNHWVGAAFGEGGWHV